jgi:hypothetical protein
VFFIEFVLLPGGFPENNEMVIFSFLFLPHLKNDRVQMLSHPTDCPVLLRPIRALVKHLFEPDASLE